MLIVDGNHVPVIPLFEVLGNVPGVSPIQYGPSAVNVGVTSGVTVTVIVVVVAQPPPEGVNV